MLELAAPPPYAGCRALLDAKQLRLEQGLDYSRAVDGDERASATPAQLVHLPRNELLAGAAFTRERPVAGNLS